MSSKISLIIHREYVQRVRKKSFIISTLLVPLLMVGMMVVPILLTKYSKDEQRQIAVIDHSGVIANQMVSNEISRYTDVTQQLSYEEAEKEMKDTYGFLVIEKEIVDDPTAMKLYTRKSSTMGLENDISRQVQSIIESERIQKTNITGLDSIMQSVKAKTKLTTYTISTAGAGNEKTSSSTISFAVGYIGGFIMYMFVFIYGAMVMQGVIEEKSSRIIEVMISSVKPMQLMMGKILGIALVALTQIMVWAVLFMTFSLVMSGLMSGGAEMQDIGGAGAMMQGIDSESLSMIKSLIDPAFLFKILGLYIIYFAGGYLLYASMFAAVGSAVNDVQDTQQLQIPITIPLFLGILILITAMKNPDTGAAFWFSIIPFTSPIVMMARIPYGVPLWELLLSLALLYGTFLAMTWFAAKIYRVGIFMYGKKPTLKEVIKWSKYKF